MNCSEMRQSHHVQYRYLRKILKIEAFETDSFSKIFTLEILALKAVTLLLFVSSEARPVAFLPPPETQKKIKGTKQIVKT